jgi:hypothetical protein
MADQVATRRVSVEHIMTSHYFLLGFLDKINHRSFHKQYDTWPRSKDGHSPQWSYDRGRLFAAATGGKILPFLPKTKKLNQAAVHAFATLIMNKDII